MAKSKMSGKKKAFMKKKVSVKKKASSKKTADAGRSITLSITNIRCFAEKQELKIKPLTFLTGENSTGKTTVLCCLNAVSKLVSGKLDFNKAPYKMGSFDDIINKKTEDIKNPEFEIGIDSEDLKTQVDISFIKKQKGEEPIVRSIKIAVENGNGLNCDYVNSRLVLSSSKDKNIPIPIPIPFKDDMLYIPLFILLDVTMRTMNLKSDKKPIRANTQKRMEQFSDLFRKFLASVTPVLSIAPIRSKPERTYNPMREGFDPEGKEIPMTLMLLKSYKEEKWDKLYGSLLEFGKASGLFSDIKVEKLKTQSTSGPFQLQFKIRGSLSNIMDTGYGISQILPLLVNIFRAPKRYKFLLQQPEVHLHPKAQAELSSLLIEGIKSRQHSFVVETHSDYMVDRACIEIRKGNISPNDVSLIHLEHSKDGTVKAHNISFDKEGNILNAPSGYRDFFSKETDRFLGFEK